MTNEERDLISSFVQRVGGNPASSGFGGSVPQVGTQPLPPVDPQADTLLADLFTRYPESRYRMTQLAFVQEHAVAAAANQIAALQAQIQQMQQQMQQAQQSPPPQPAASPWGQQASQPVPQPSRGLFGGLFGGSSPQPAPQYAPQQQFAPQQQYAPQPQYAPGYQPGMFQRSGSGFLGSALTTAAGVAGGMMAANALEGLFSGHHAGGGLGSTTSYGGDTGGFGGAGQDAGAAPWATPAVTAPDPFAGGEQKDFGAQAPVDNGWQDGAAAPDSGWQDSAAAPDDGGWTDTDNS